MQNKQKLIIDEFFCQIMISFGHVLLEVKSIVLINSRM